MNKCRTCEGCIKLKIAIDDKDENSLLFIAIILIVITASIYLVVGGLDQVRRS